MQTEKLSIAQRRALAAFTASYRHPTSLSPPPAPYPDPTPPSLPLPPPSGLARLPNELLLLITSYLRTQDAHALFLTTRRLSTLTSTLTQKIAADITYAVATSNTISLPTHPHHRNILHHATAYSAHPLLSTLLPLLPRAAISYLSQPDTHGVTPLLLSIINRDLRSTHLLLQHGAEVNIHPPCYGGLIWSSPESRGRWGADGDNWGFWYDTPDGKRQNGRLWENTAVYGTPLQHAVHAVYGKERDEWMGVVRLLQEMGADPYVPLGEYGDPLVCMGVVRDDAELVGLLVGREGYVANTRCFSGECGLSAMDVAVVRGGAGVVGEFLKKGLSGTWEWVRRWDEKLGRKEERLWPWLWESWEERFAGELLDAVEEKGRMCLEAVKVWC